MGKGEGEGGGRGGGEEKGGEGGGKGGRGGVEERRWGEEGRGGEVKENRNRFLSSLIHWLCPQGNITK